MMFARRWTGSTRSLAAAAAFQSLQRSSRFPNRQSEIEVTQVRHRHRFLYRGAVVRSPETAENGAVFFGALC